MKNNEPSKAVAEARRQQAERERGYREQALKLFPWVCGRCGRDFNGKRLSELTVHHRDHDHNNNPPDGSNWELLCLYCHDNEHARQLEAQARGASGPAQESVSTYKAFADLAERLKKKSER